MQKSHLVMPAVILALGATAWLVRGMPADEIARGTATFLSSLGGAANALLSYFGVSLTTLILPIVMIVVMWGLSLAIMFARKDRSDWRIYGEHIAWGIAIAVGLLAFIVPGIIIWAVMAKVKGGANALLVLLGPIGSAIVAGSDLSDRWIHSTPISIVTPMGFPMALGIPLKVKEIARSNIALTILGTFTVLGVLGILSRMIWRLGPFVHILIYIGLGIGLALALIKFMGAEVWKRKLWLAVGILIFVTMLSISDILVSGMKWIGALVPITSAQAGILGGLEGGPILLISIFGGPIFGALFGQMLSSKWSIKKIAVVVSLAIISALMVLVALGGI